MPFHRKQTAPRKDERSTRPQTVSPTREDPLRDPLQRQSQQLHTPKQQDPAHADSSTPIQLRDAASRSDPDTHSAKADPATNNTGVPDALKTGVENLSGMDMSDVKVHYNSAEPAAVGASAFTQGSDIHVAPGQEQHLGHEMWHVVQQKQGRVAPTMQLKGIDINASSSLESEADTMGAQAAALGSRFPSTDTVQASARALGQPLRQGAPVQRKVRQFMCGGSSGGNKQVEPATETKTFRGWEKDPNLADVVKTGIVEHVNVAVGALEHGGFILQDTPLQQYIIKDESHIFYSAVPTAALPSIKEKGLDPSYGGKQDPANASEWNSRGYVYMGATPKICSTYAKHMGGGKSKTTVLGFRLPAGTVLTVDPEIANGLRTRDLISSGQIDFSNANIEYPDLPNKS